MDVMVELKPIGALFQEGKVSAGLQKLHSLWDLIPGPKAATPNAYLIIEYGVAFALKAGDLGEAQWWADNAPDFKAARQDMGEVEFLLGRVAFERGDHEAARENFMISNVKSEGRSFVGKDFKYKRLIG